METRRTEDDGNVWHVEDSMTTAYARRVHVNLLLEQLSLLVLLTLLLFQLLYLHTLA
jgi:hypothetical protein